MNQIRTADGDKKFFKPIVGSNYKILMSYDRNEIVEYAQFLKIMTLLNDKDTMFMSVNNRVIAKRSIIDISPTKEMTEDQLIRLAEKRRSEIQAMDRNNRLTTFKSGFNEAFFDQKYGKKQWTWCKFLRLDDRHLIDGDDYTACWNAFEKQYPAEAKEIMATS